MQADVVRTVPPLREDLRLHPTGRAREGAPAWVIQDPVTNRFYRIGWFEYECLLRWSGNVQTIADEVSRQTPIQASSEEVQAFERFLQAHHLVRPQGAALERLKAGLQVPRWRHWKWWLHNYLFFRVPLVRPDAFLNALLPWVAPLFTRSALWIFSVLTLIGLMLVMRQWDVFTHSVMALVTPQGLLGFALALLVSKTLHELGHAIVATRQGLRVAHMGVAFLVLWPMLYTDTGETWRLKHSRQRLAISVAGIGTELVLAGLATLAWVLLDDGILRQAMLYLATTGWVLSLLLNLSPFMRFDGYYILSDFLNLPNLHEQAGALATTAVRRFILGVRDPWPIQTTARARQGLIAFALVTWLYRLLVFLGIATMVYFLFFKVLGIFLMLVEVMCFVVRPIAHELKVWKERWSEVAVKRKTFLWSLVTLGFVIVAMPWPFHVQAHGVVRPARYQLVYAPQAASVVSVTRPSAVKAGETLVHLEVPELADRRTRIEATLVALQRRLAGLTADETLGQARLRPLLQQLQAQRSELAAVARESDRLVMRAGFSGDWRDVPPELTSGAWIDTAVPVGVLVDPTEWVVDAYVGQRDVARLLAGAKARFHVDGTHESMEAVVEFIDSSRSQHLAHPMLESVHGGPVSTRAGGDGLATPVDALYRVRLVLQQPPQLLREACGWVVIDAASESTLWRGMQHLVAIFVRESGF